jgi:hypothetical protein
MRFQRSIALFVAVLGISACASLNRTPAAPQPQTTVEVDNRAFLDMTIYVTRGNERVRLGVATGASKTTLVIPAYFVQGYPVLRFVADPIGGTHAQVSEDVNVSPGDEVTMQIPPV